MGETIKGVRQVLSHAAHSAIIGVSLDSHSFTREWVRFAISHTLARHRDVELFLGDRLLYYNKAVVDGEGEYSVDFRSARTRIEKRKRDMTSFIGSEIERLSADDQTRVRIASWIDYADVLFEDMVRNLHIAYCALPVFRDCVDRDVDVHFNSRPESMRAEVHSSLSSLYVIEETAMIIRITELAGRPFFYYPQDDIVTLRSIYNDECADQGLSVEALTGKPKSRVYTALPLPTVPTARGEA